MEQDLKQQGRDLIYALDIGTRSIIGVVGRVEDERFRVLAIEKIEHGKRAMLDGQIEDIGQVARVVSAVTGKLEERLDRRLNQVCIAAAGRALHTEQGRFELTLPSTRRIDEDLISQLEAGAVTAAESALIGAGGQQDQFFLVGYTVSRYLLDHYPLSTLMDHNGQSLEAEVVATFLPGEVVESLYSAMRMAGLEVVSLTLEPIAALNAAIPAELRLLNLVLADIGAGTSDIAACRDGSVVGYTMATVAGDEITESIMRAYLVDFTTAEQMKAAMGCPQPICFTDILGLEQQISGEALYATIEPQAKAMAMELSRRILEVNGGTPSALFLAGGGSKLEGLRELMAQTLELDPRRVSIAGNHYKVSAFSEEYDLNDPELATPLGIAVSAGLGLINDSYRVTLNNQPAKLFRNGTLTALDVLLMNGFGYHDLIGKTGQSISVTIDGKRTVFRGEPATPSVLRINGKEAPPTTVIQTGDSIEFIPARSGQSAKKDLADAIGAAEAEDALLNGTPTSAAQELKSGDVIVTRARPHQPVQTVTPSEEPVGVVAKMVFLNGMPLVLPAKTDGGAYYLMDLLTYSHIDFEHLERSVILQVNGREGQFAQELKDGDDVTIQYEEEA